ncbi:MAG: D-alanine--D-alanine ligase [Chloroflexi bacterium]|nr:MAG: D-alanine--D-alanine ligase [Chloroflexota bacterium]HDN81037.1 D-alanine--D-alanine ligase [Chloroflexota bacterium]
MKRKLRVGVIFGGRSGEHEVSLASAQSVIAALDKEKYEVIPIGITKEGKWIASGDPMKALQAGIPEASAPVALLGDPTHKALMRLDITDQATAIRAIRLHELDVVFPVLHGPYGEDGTVQGLLELAGIPYVGAGVLASAVGMDKPTMKAVFKAHGLPVVKHVVIRRKHWEQNPEAIMDEIESTLGYPCFVKPANLGSSVGVSKARNRQELDEALKLAARYDRKMLAEVAINAREIECSVLGNDDPIASVPGEVVPHREFYDYKAKYIPGESDLIIPAPIPPELAQHIQELAIKAFLAVDCAGMARVDFFLDRDTGQVYVNELNTIPGFTATSMYPKMWEASGIPYPELLDRLIELALERFEDKSRCETSYVPDWE